jgi:hypothetical protein
MDRLTASIIREMTSVHRRGEADDQKATFKIDEIERPGPDLPRKNTRLDRFVSQWPGTCPLLPLKHRSQIP